MHIWPVTVTSDVVLLGTRNFQQVTTLLMKLIIAKFGYLPWNGFTNQNHGELPSNACVLIQLLLGQSASSHVTYADNKRVPYHEKTCALHPWFCSSRLLEPVIHVPTHMQYLSAFFGARLAQ